MEDSAPPGRLATVAAYALVLVLAVLCAVWGAFLVPLRVAGFPVPVGVLIAVVGNVSLGRAGVRITGSLVGAVGPGAVWLLIVLAFGMARPEGDVIIPGSARGLAFIGLGLIAALSVVGVGPARSGPRSDDRPG